MKQIDGALANTLMLLTLVVYKSVGEHIIIYAFSKCNARIGEAVPVVFAITVFIGVAVRLEDELTPTIVNLYVIFQCRLDAGDVHVVVFAVLLTRRDDRAGRKQPSSGYGTLSVA